MCIRDRYKNILVSKRLIRRLLKAYGDGNIVIRRESKDFGGWYNKRTAAVSYTHLDVYKRQEKCIIRFL